MPVVLMNLILRRIMAATAVPNMPKTTAYSFPVYGLPTIKERARNEREEHRELK